MLLLTFVIVSCSSDNDTKEIENEMSAKFLSENFVRAEVAYRLSGEVKLGVLEKDLINSFNNYSEKVELGTKAVRLEILTIEDKNYIRFYNEDKSVSTVALLKTSKIENLTQNGVKMMIGETVCTSGACANCCGCIPDGSYCSPCELNNNDCRRTTSG